MSVHIAATWTIAIPAIISLALCCTSYFTHRPQHAGSGEGALTVRHLIARVEAETSCGGRHRLRAPVIDQPLVDDETTELPKLPPNSYARDAVTLQRILAGLRRW